MINFEQYVKNLSIFNDSIKIFLNTDIKKPHLLAITLRIALAYH